MDSDYIVLGQVLMDKIAGKPKKPEGKAPTEVKDTQSRVDSPDSIAGLNLNFGYLHKKSVFNDTELIRLIKVKRVTFSLDHLLIKDDILIFTSKTGSKRRI